MGDEALNSLGFPLSHGQPISNIATQEQMVILIRAVGPVCQGLIEERYDTKSFRIHGKSCDWGPMAGFVCRDPRLNKKGLLNAGYNTKEHNNALYPQSKKEVEAGFSAKTAPIYITNSRLQWLIDGGEKYLGRSPDRGDLNMIRGTVTGGNVTLHYVLIRDPSDSRWWGLHIDNDKYPGLDFWQQMPLPTHVKESSKEARQFSIRGDEYFRYEKIIGMVNPDGDPCSRKSTVTGDYDLFGLWPHKDKYLGNQLQDDRRIARTQADKDIFKAENDSAQGFKLGNYSEKVLRIGKAINQSLGHTVCHHSDEAGRPKIDDVDLPVIAFVPGNVCRTIDNQGDLDRFIGDCISAGYLPEYNKAWYAQVFAKRHGYLPGRSVDDLMQSSPRAPGGSKEAPARL